MPDGLICRAPAMRGQDHCYSTKRRFLRRDSAGYEFVRAVRRQDRLEKAARYFVHLLVNEGLRGEVSPAVLPYEGSAIRFWPHSLIGAMYLLLATEVAGQRSAQRPCDQCAMSFTAGRSDARFCGTACRSRAAYLRRRADAMLATRA